MKTVTNYAEKKAKQILNLLQGYTKGIRFTAILILLLMGVSNAWAYNLAASQYVYFEKPADWSNVSLLLGHNSWSQGYNMTKITNTNLYYWKTDQWDGYTRYCFIDGKDWGGEGKKPDDRKGYASHSTNVFTNQLIKYHLFTSSGSKSSHASDRKIAINRTQTIKVQLKDGSNWVDATVVPADLTASTYAMTTSSTAVSAASASLAKESTTVSATVDAAYSATVSLSCTNVLDGYMFEGWYDANGNKITSYTVSDEHTVYARFVQSAEETNEVSVTYMCDAIEVSPAIAEIVGVETEKSFTAPTVTGYNFTGWTIGAGITLKAGTASDATITVVTKSASSDYTLVANYEEVMETIYFINTGNWSVVNLYRWGGTATETPWPGEAMTSTGEKIGEYDVYSFTAQQGAFANVIFTNKTTGSDQTGDLTWTAGKYYIYNYGGNSGWYTKAEAEELLVVPIVTHDIVVKAVAPEVWNSGTISIHYWGDGISATSKPVATEKDGNWNKYTIKNVPEGTSVNVIFINGTDWNGNANQTANITGITEDKCFQISAKNKDGEGKCTVEEVDCNADITPEGDDYYTVVGVAELFGEAWATNNDANKMVKQDDGSYKLVKENVTLAAIGYDWKIAKNGDWWDDAATGVNPSGGKNNTLTIQTAGRYNVTFTLAANLQTATAEPELLEAIIVIPDCYISGNATLTGGEGWQGNEFTMVYDEETKTWTYTLAGLQPEKEYELKVVCGGTWYSFANLATPVPTGVTEGNDHAIAFQMEEAGDVVVTYNNTNGITIDGNFVKFINVYLAGQMTNWGEGKLQFRKKAAGDEVATVSVELTEGVYEFKIVEDETWLGNNGTMTRQYHENWIFRAKQDDGTTDEVNATIDADANGTYTFVWNSDRNELTVTYPAPTAKYIYFKNNPGWDSVYVYFFQEDNFNDKGAVSTGLTVANKRVGEMTQVGSSDIWQYEYGTAGLPFSGVIAFTETLQEDKANFKDTKAAYRADFNKNMELFIPQETSNETKNNTKYYSTGLWMKYNSTESGYVFAHNIDAEWNEDQLVADAPGGYHFDTRVALSENTTYNFKIKNIKDDWFGKKSTTITSTNTDVELEVGAGDEYNVQLTTTSPGFYIISIDLSDGKMMVSVEYPLLTGDYRMVYVERLGQEYTKFHPAQSIRYQAEGEKKDTISFYINKSNNPAILLQQCTNINGDIITWTDVAIQNINGNGGVAPTAALAPAKRAGELYIGTGSVDVTKNGVYNFTLSQTDGSATILNEETHPYTGNYYIRTNAAEGGWRKYNTNPDNIMTYSQTALKHGDYDYYFCKWVLKDQSVQYVVANDYSYCVSDTLTTDAIVTNVNGILPANANVRYTWNSSTNTLSRAYLAGSGIISDRYLVLVGNANLKDTSGNPFNVSGLEDNEVAFKDMENWLYQLDVKANQNTLVKLTADYNKKTQYFKGSADETEQLIKGSEDYYTLRLIYDFKTNYLVSGLVGNQTITGNLELEEVMIVRSHHDEAQTLKISGNGRVTANKAYGVMTFNKSTLNGAGSEHERALYWVSFPFDVKLDEAFGFGNYGEHWIMEYYDGKERAEKGLWKEPTYSYWKYITDPTNYTLEAGQGYVLCLDLDLLGNDSEFWDHENTEIALYFPSSEENPIVINNAATQRETRVPEYICTIERDDRDIHDSNWNIIGVPAYTKIAKMVGENIFYYQYNAADNTYVSDVTPNFNTMHAYMVQFAGIINWTEQATSIAALAARKSPTSKDQYTLRLALQQEDAQCDHTFIRLQEDNTTAEFDMNYDLCKIINSGANIYSMIGNVEVAANVLPVEERVIPLGLDIHETGNYTFAMPDGTDGITAILIDYETGTETNLLLADYTTELREGTNNDRFALRVRPNHVTTEVENTIQTDGNDNAKKYIIDGALYLLRDGKLYDAQGRMVQQ